MRRDLAGDLDSIGLGFSNGADGPHGADVGNMHRQAEVLRQGDVAPDDYLLGHSRYRPQPEHRRHRPLVGDAILCEGVILGMLYHRHTECGGVLQGAAHHPGIHHAAAVVGDRDGTRLGHLADLRQFLPLQALGDGADWINGNHGVPLGGLQHEFYNRGAVDRR